MQTIITKYYGPTNTRGARIVAQCERDSLSIPYPYELDGDDCHEAAAQALVDRFLAEDLAKRNETASANPWNRRRIIGGTGRKGERAHVFYTDEP
jgi:hypothetical protein